MVILFIIACSLDARLSATGQGDPGSGRPRRAAGGQEIETRRLFWGEGVVEVGRGTVSPVRQLGSLLCVCVCARACVCVRVCGGEGWCVCVCARVRVNE